MYSFKKRCPRCAERVRAQARVCRYCSHEFEDRQIEATSRFKLRPYILVVSVFIIAAVSWIGFDMWRDLQRSHAADAALERAAALVDDASVVAPSPYEPIALGATFEWVAKDAEDKVVRKAGPFLVTITKKNDDEFVAPLVNVSAGNQTVTVEGESVGSGYSHKISFFENRTGSVPVIMLQSFSGGAHCCNTIHVVGFVRDRLQAIDLGSWDGDAIEVPKDISGDGVVDFVMNDNSFLYAFACYACSYAPPQVFNIVDGKFKDVSRNPAFKSLYAKEMSDSGKACVSGSGDANGACPAYVASAARVGQLNRAWSRMLASYDASADWELPTGCSVPLSDECPSEAQIVYKSYPEALLAFLKRQGYVPQNWLPPEAYRTPVEEVPNLPTT